MKSYDLFAFIKKELGFNNKELSRCLGISVADLGKWKNDKFIPSYLQMINMVHFAKIMKLNYPKLMMRDYFEEALLITYKDKYRIDGGIDHKRNLIHISSMDGLEGKCFFEDIRNTDKKPLLQESE